MHAPLTSTPSTRLAEVKQSGKDFIVEKDTSAPVTTPAIGLGDSFIQITVGVVEPRGSGIIEVCECAFGRSIAIDSCAVIIYFSRSGSAKGFDWRKAYATPH